MFLMIALASMFALVVIMIVVLVDMFKQHALWGIAGFIVWPLILVHLLVAYSGSKIKMLILIAVLISAITGSFIYISKKAKGDIKPFVTAVAKEHNMKCEYSGSSSEYYGLMTYGVVCDTAMLKSIENYKNVDEMLEEIKNKIVLPIHANYVEFLKNSEKIGLVLQFKKDEHHTCYQMHAKPEFIKAYSQSSDNNCELLKHKKN